MTKSWPGASLFWLETTVPATIYLARIRKLQNTCGGISETKTFKTPVRVLVRSDEGQEEGEHLELVLEDDAEEQLGKNSERDVIKAERA